MQIRPWDTDLQNSRRPSGFSLIELLVSIAVVSLLLGLSFMAVQAARESARVMQCLNNQRNLALAGTEFESMFRRLPGAYFNANPMSASYRYDSGLFVNLLPFFGDTNLRSQFRPDVPSASLPNGPLLLQRPAILKCPSSGPSARLTQLADRWSGASVDGLNALTCDYVGNGGVGIDGVCKFGSVRFRIDNWVDYRQVREITDGLTHTLWFWESIGDKIYRPDRSIDMDSYAARIISYYVDVEDQLGIHSITRGSTKSYVYAWTGIRTGAVYPYDPYGNVALGSSALQGRVANVRNELGEPYSAHPGGFTVSFLDTSTRQLSVLIDAPIMMAWATSNNNDMAIFE
jgi:prepilin-type N-terminal cleavage/methylation domain-containing protein